MIYKSIRETFLQICFYSGNQKVIRLAEKCQQSQMPMALGRKLVGKETN
jgi:hypothetical protein